MSSDWLKILACDRVYDPGCHNAFTDMIEWRGRIWLVFREALNHSVHPSSQIVVLASADLGKTFQLQSRFASSGTDVRDPKLFVHDDQVHLVVPSYRLADRQLLTMIARSSTGLSWEEHRIPVLDKYVMWRPRKTIEDGVTVHYAAAYGGVGDAKKRHVKLLRSTTGLDWKEVSVIHDRDQPNETDICILKNGELLALVRREDEPNFPLLARNTTPYTGEWKKLDCDQFLQGPLLEDLGDGRLLVVGRSPLKIGQKEKNPRVTRIFALDPETARLTPGQTLESGADNSYAALVRLPADTGAPWNALLSYYSGHGYDNGHWQGGNNPQRAAIYVARVII
jgi:hypothetical protein